MTSVISSRPSHKRTLDYSARGFASTTPSSGPISSDESFGAKLRTIAKEATTKVSGTVTHIAGTAFRGGRAAAQQTCERISSGVGTTGRALKAQTTRGLERIAIPPGRDPKLYERLVSFAPGISSLQTFSTGWMTYHHGKNQQDATVIERGLEQILVAFGEAGCDLTTLGLASGLRQHRLTARIVGGGLQVLGLARLLRFKGFSTDPIRAAATLGARTPVIRDAAVWFAESFSPSVPPHSAEVAAQASSPVTTEASHSTP